VSLARTGSSWYDTISRAPVVFDRVDSLPVGASRMKIGYVEERDMLRSDLCDAGRVSSRV
jgi:hypothetical protein